MLQILAVTFPFFALIAVGYLAAQTRILPLESVPGLNTFVLYFALSAMLFSFGAKTPVAELLHPVVLGIWLITGLAVIALAVVVARRRQVSWMDAAFGGLISVLPNSGFMGLPLLIALLGEVAAGVVIATLLVDLVVIHSLGIALSHRGTSGGGLVAELKGAVSRMVSNPMPWSIVLGALWGRTGLTLPGPVSATIELLAAAASPVALFTIGAVLARERRTEATMVAAGPGVRRWGDIPWLTALKLFVHPGLAWLLGRGAIALGLPISEQVLTALVLTAALPAAANVSVLAEKFGANNGRVAQVILISTVISFATFTLAVALLT